MVYFEGKPVVISKHALLRARERGVAFPYQVYATILHGKVKRIGKNHVLFIRKGKRSTIICVGVDTGNMIIIKTVERGK